MKEMFTGNSSSQEQYPRTLADNAAEIKSARADGWAKFAQPGFEESATNVDIEARAKDDFEKGLISIDEYSDQLALARSGDKTDETSKS